jgi:hypothetical protein
MKTKLTDLPELQWEASFFLVPGRTNSGMVSAERSIGINVSALDFHVATDLLRVLHSWEVLIRAGRRLTPPALVPREANIEAEVQTTCDFHITHLSWSFQQDWVFEFVTEVFELHARGMSAAKRFVQKARRIPCPTDDCKRFVVIDVENLGEEVSCFGCKQKWSVFRLIALALSNPSRQFFLDVEAISMWLRITEREVYRIIKNASIERRGKLYDLNQIVKVRQAS